jgi:hypothetical protein
MRKLQTLLAKKLGKDVPYNFVAHLMDTSPASMLVCEGRGEDRSGAHTKGHNTKGIGIIWGHNTDLQKLIGVEFTYCVP